MQLDLMQEEEPNTTATLETIRQEAREAAKADIEDMIRRLDPEQQEQARKEIFAL